MTAKERIALTLEAQNGIRQLLRQGLRELCVGTQKRLVGADARLAFSLQAQIAEAIKIHEALKPVRASDIASPGDPHGNSAG